jgi:CheY-like chemotaxis protein
MFSRSPEARPQAERILVVDDLPDNCFLLQMVLESEGYQVEVAASGPAALDKIATCLPDLVLLDVMMPDMDGFEVTRQLRHNPALPFIPVLLVTGYNELTAADGFAVGATGLIRKPIDLDQLLHQIRTILLPST